MSYRRHDSQCLFVKLVCASLVISPGGGEVRVAIASLCLSGVLGQLRRMVDGRKTDNLIAGRCRPP